MCHQRILIATLFRRTYKTTEISTFRGDTEYMVSRMYTSSVIRLITTGVCHFSRMNTNRELRIKSVEF